MPNPPDHTGSGGFGYDQAGDPAPPTRSRGQVPYLADARLAGATTRDAVTGTGQPSGTGDVHNRMIGMQITKPTHRHSNRKYSAI